MEFALQVGGHQNAFKRSNEVGKLLKPLQTKNRGQREVDFYNTVHEKNESLAQIVPKYFGVIDKQKDCFLVLQDLTVAFKNPNIMDIKLGTKSYEPTASAEKIAYEKSKWPLQETLGFRFQAMKVYDTILNKHIDYAKEFGRSLTNDTLPEAFYTFLGGDQEREYRMQHNAIPKIVARLQTILDTFEKQRSHIFVASSLLFIYQSNAGIDHPEPLIDIKLIDFGHVRYQNEFGEKDEDCIVGIHTLLSQFNAIRDRDQQNATDR